MDSDTPDPAFPAPTPTPATPPAPNPPPHAPIGAIAPTLPDPPYDPDDIHDGESEHIEGFQGVRALSHPRQYRGDPAERPLLPREALFVHEFMVDMNPTAAAGRAGYRWPAGTASRLIRRPNVAAAISRAMDARAARVGVTADRVLQEIAWLAFSRLSDVARWDRTEDGREILEVLPSEALAGMPGPGAALSEIRLLVGGGLRVRLHDKVGALTLLCRHMGLLRDKVGLLGPKEPPPPPADLTFREFLDGTPAHMRQALRALILEMEAARIAAAEGPEQA